MLWNCYDIHVTFTHFKVENSGEPCPGQNQRGSCSKIPTPRKEMVPNVMVGIDNNNIFSFCFFAKCLDTILLLTHTTLYFFKYRLQ